ncbi:MAG: hypothetical protein KFB97_01415 [Cyanobium sp. M30B3]|nr:MAG: hypothetical protein KFB97_01415 [Cyanobium sp. M30B3]
MALALSLSTAGSWLPLRAAPPTPQLLQSLEAAFNGEGELQPLLEPGPGLDPGLVERQRRVLRAQFPDARWQLIPDPAQGDGRSTVTVQVRGSRQDGPLRFRLQAEQQLALDSDGRRITGQTVLREQSILRSGEGDLAVTLQIPDVVLTGQRYDVDVLLDEPLEGAIVAGGIVELTAEQARALESPNLQLGALGGGGLFRTVQAPLTPGSQTWAVLLVHPQGLVSVSKRVRVVADKAQLKP